MSTSTQTSMRFTSAASDAVNAQQAAEQVVRQVLEQLNGASCDLACVFVSTLYRAAWPSILTYLTDHLAPASLIGCSGSGIIGGEREFEWVPALSVVAAHLPGVTPYPFAVSPDELELASPGGFWIDKIGASPTASPVFILMADPFTCDAAKLVQELNTTYRSRPIIGGLVSGGSNPGEHVLFMNEAVLHEGAVGVGMTGNITMDTIVSQGCRPFGRPAIVTKAEDTVIWELGGRPALEALHWALTTLSPDDRELAQQGSVFVGLVVDELRDRFGSGDFVIRNIVGLDPNAGALAVAERVQVGQTVQFHLRDANASREELRRLLARRESDRGEGLPLAGGLLFNCLGRGKAFYGSAHHDLKTIQTISGRLPIGGFFCNGEIGPIGDTNFLHGYTASLALFRPQDPAGPHGA